LSSTKKLQPKIFEPYNGSEWMRGSYKALCILKIMAEDKKGFILYADQIDLFSQLPNDKAGELIKHIFAYVNDEDPQTDDLIINIAFTPIKKQFKRDLEKWTKTREGRSIAGKASAEARRIKKEQEVTNSTNVKSVEQIPTNPTVNDNVNVNVNVKDITIEIYPTFEDFWELYDKKQDKPKSILKWNKLTQSVKEQIIDYIPKYKLSQPDKQYRKNPTTFLNNESWNNEIVINADAQQEIKQSQIISLTNAITENSTKFLNNG